MPGKSRRYKIKPKILILEDDSDQMTLLIDFALIEIKKLLDSENINNKQRLEIENIQLIKVSNITSLQRSVVRYKNVILAVLDCNTPDVKGGPANDQLVKTSRGIITGQHRAVDLVNKYLPDAPITLISSMDRFQKIVKKHYASNDDLRINFVRKSDPFGLKGNIRYYLKKYVGL